MTAKNYFIWMFLVAFSSKGLAIKCFQCNSAEYPVCRNLTSRNTDSPFYQKCLEYYDGHLPFCRKMETHVLYVDEIRVVRTCGWIKRFDEPNEDKCKKGDTDFIKKITCSCFSDGCNSSHKIGKFQYCTLLSLTLCLHFIFKYYVTPNCRTM